jgi:hypothetical protein
VTHTLLSVVFGSCLKRLSVALDDGAEPDCAVLGKPIKCLVIDIIQPEALLVTVAPLVIIEQTPVKIAADVYAITRGRCITNR